MAELNAPIVAKASGTASEVPLPADLEVAELAVNTADGKLFTKHTDGAIITISSDISSLANIEDVEYLSVQTFSDLTNSTGSTSSSSVTSSGEWNIPASVNNFNFHQDSSTEMSLLQVGDSVTFEAYGLTHTTTVLTAASYSSGVRWTILMSPAFPTAWQGPTMPSGEAVIITSTRFPATVVDPTDGQVLTWVDANSQWEPVQLPDAAATRTLLGIGEYADDTAAGTGGISSGAMYYNTTSSDYRLKS